MASTRTVIKRGRMYAGRRKTITQSVFDVCDFSLETDDDE
jgi:hypothetical protein